MREKRPQRRFERIVVACDQTPSGSAALEAATALAASLQAELAGLFVEDVNLLRMAALPFTRELGLATALIRPIETTDIEREFRRQSDEARKALESAALGASLRWSFRVIRGEPLTTALSAARIEDLLVVGAKVHSAPRGARAPPRAGGEAAAARMQHGLRARPIAMVFDGTAQAEHALSLAAALGRQVDVPLTIWIAADDEADYARRSEQARAWLAGNDGTMAVSWLRGRDLRAVGEAVAAEAPAMLVWHDALDSRQLSILLSAVRCPLVWVR